jgi:hypothetical protein
MNAAIPQAKALPPWRKHPPELRANVAALRAAGLSQAKVSRRLNLPQGSIWHLSRPR